VGEQVKPWRVLHACESVEDAVALAEAESSVGMNPQLLSREYWNPGGASQDVSLMNAWHDVRDWRHALNEVEALTSVQIVHAHSFASAMAGVRGSLPLVFDFAATLEDVATHQSHGTSGPWLLRSLRVAEQFALSRSGAVVAHTEAMSKIANERGAASENIFVVPEPWTSAGAVGDVEWLAKQGIHPDRDLVIFALPDKRGLEFMLRSFAAIMEELPQAVFVAECEQQPLTKLKRKLGQALRWVKPAERAHAMVWANVIVAPAAANCGANPVMLQAMATGRAVVAADVPENRECSREGRGCIWYDSSSDTDLAQRTAFVARNREFARSLGESGREHIAATRGPAVIGKKYDEIYRHVQARRTENTNIKVEMPKIYALGMQT
jgi:glycosyltransferase involved in cell wall biosynthesis